MAMCEDYPCCGHALNDCPDSDGRMPCVECGVRLSADAQSSICPRCLRKMSDSMDNGDFDFDTSMNY